MALETGPTGSAGLPGHQSNEGAGSRAFDTVKRFRERFKKGEVPRDPEAIDRDTNVRQGTDWEYVCLGILPELRAKLEARREAGEKGLEVLPGEKERRIDGVLYRQPQILGILGDRRSLGCTDADYVLMYTLVELNNAALYTTRGGVEYTRRKKIVGEGIEQYRRLVGDNDHRFEELNRYVENYFTVHEYIREFWLQLRGGSKDAVGKLLEKAGSKFTNDILLTFLRDPEVFRGFHEIKGKQAGDWDFIRGGKYDFKDPITGKKEAVVIRGRDYGGAEQIGAFFRQITLWGAYDGYGVAAENMYNAMKARWFREFALTKGWMKEGDALSMEIYDDGVLLRAPDGTIIRAPRIIPHTPCAYPTMLHAPNATGEEYLRYLLTEKEATDRGIDPLVIGEGLEAVENLGLSWQDKARLMCRYAKGDIRNIEGQYVYTREEFENATPENQRAMYERAKKETWAVLSYDAKLTIVQNNLINDRWIMDSDSDGKPMVVGGRIVGRNFDYEGVKHGVKPTVDLDSFIEVEKDGLKVKKYRMDEVILKMLERAKGGTFMVNEDTYEGYATGTRFEWEEYCGIDEATLQKTWQNLLKATNTREMFRTLPGRDAPDFRRGLYQKWLEEHRWPIEAFSPRFYLGLVGARLSSNSKFIEYQNQYTEMGVFGGYHDECFENAGLFGVSYEQLVRAGLEPNQVCAYFLSKYAHRETWAAFIDRAVASFPSSRGAEELQRLTDQQKLELMAAYAGFRIKPADYAQESAKPIEARLAKDTKDKRDGVVTGLLTADERRRLESDLSFWRARGMEGNFELLEQAEVNGRVVIPGEIARFYDFELDRKGTFGAERFGGEYDQLRTSLDFLIRNTGFFSPSNFLAPRQEEKLIWQLMDVYYTDRIEPQRRTEREKVGLPANDEMYRHKFFNRMRRRYLRHNIGANMLGRSILSRYATVDEVAGGNAIPGQGLETYADHSLVPGVKIRVSGKNTYVEMRKVSKPEKDPADANATETIPYPVILMFNRQNPAYRSSADAMWDLAQGTGELENGQSAGYFPQHTFYERNCELHRVVLTQGTPEYTYEVGRLAIEYWIKDKLYRRLATPRKIRALIEHLGPIESDHDWARSWWRDRLGYDNDFIERFKQEQANLAVTDVEKGVFESQTEGLKETTASFFKWAKLGGIGTLLLEPFSGTPAQKSIKLRLAAVPYTIGASVIAVNILANTERVAVALNSLSPNLFNIANIRVLGSQLVANVVIAVGTMLVSSIVVKILGGDTGQDREGDEREPNIGAWGKTLHAYKARVGMIAKRRDACSYDRILLGKGVWDDTVDPKKEFDDFKSNRETKAIATEKVV